MIDRVPPGLGLLGPVDDAEAMAANVQAIWASDRAAIARQSRAHAEQFRWERTFEQLFDDIYPRALAHAALRARTGRRAADRAYREALAG